MIYTSSYFFYWSWSLDQARPAVEGDRMARHEFRQSFRSSVASLFPFSERFSNPRRTKKLPGFVSVPGSLCCCSLEVRSAATMPSSRRRTQQGTLRPGDTCTRRHAPVDQFSHRDGAHSCILSRRRPSTTSTLRYRTNALVSSIFALIENCRHVVVIAISRG